MIMKIIVAAIVILCLWLIGVVVVNGIADQRAEKEAEGEENDSVMQ